MYESKRDNRLRKAWCVRTFFHISQPPPLQGIPKISWKHPRIQSSNNEKAGVYTPRLIIMARSTVDAYSEGYAWARTSENVRGREGAEIVMESIEEKTQFECLPLNWTHFLVKWSLIRPTIVLTFDLKSLKYFRSCLIHFSVLRQILTIKIIHDKLNPVTRCVHWRSNVSTCKCQWRLKIAVESD